MLSKLRQYVAAQGVGILPRDLYANLRTAPVALYGDRAAAGTAGVNTTLDETGNAEELLVGSTDYRGWIFGCAVGWSSGGGNTGLELSEIIQNCQVQFSSMGVAKNVPTGVCSSILGTSGGGTGTGNVPASNGPLVWHRFPNPVPWDGTDSASYIRLLNNNTVTSTAPAAFTVYADAWLARATDEPQPGKSILFPDDCHKSGAFEKWIEKLARESKIRSALRM